jgi:hypothetical protein
MTGFNNRNLRTIPPGTRMEALARAERNNGVQRFTEDWKQAIELPAWKPVFLCDPKHMHLDTVSDVK